MAAFEGYRSPKDGKIDGRMVIDFSGGVDAQAGMLGGAGFVNFTSLAVNAIRYAPEDSVVTVTGDVTAYANDDAATGIFAYSYFYTADVEVTGNVSAKLDLKNLFDSPYEFTQGTVVREYLSILSPA